MAGADEVLQANIAERRSVLYRFYASALYAYQGDRLKWQRTLSEVLDTEPNNPYFRWFANGATAER